jgi:hypothetical protein
MRKHCVSSVVGATMLAASVAACSGQQKPAESTPVQVVGSPTDSNETVIPPAPGLGGRLFDNWAKELRLDFAPDNPETPEADGRGGPFGNGTLPDHEGKPILNTGHDYRLKNLFGWDLRGADGIYGPRYKNKAHVLLPDLLRDTDARETWITRLEQGEDAIPAFGKVLTRPQIEAVVDFLLGIRDGALPRPDDIFLLSEGTPGNYRLVEGGDAERGHVYFTQTCAQCHGTSGTSFLLDDGAHSLGSLMRVEGHETWAKILSGQPGTGMHAQVPQGATHDELAQIVRDLNAATCDRVRYPKGAATSEDVADGDPRCGPYLK